MGNGSTCLSLSSMMHIKWSFAPVKLGCLLSPECNQDFPVSSPLLPSGCVLPGSLHRPQTSAGIGFLHCYLALPVRASTLQLGCKPLKERTVFSVSESLIVLTEHPRACSFLVVFIGKVYITDHKRSQNQDWTHRCPGNST